MPKISPTAPSSTIITMVPTSITFCAKRARRKKKEKSSVDRQHPDVTAPTTCGTLEQVLRNWEELNEGAAGWPRRLLLVLEY